MCFGGITDRGPEAFLIFKVSEAPDSQLKEFLGLVWPTTDSRNMLGWLGDQSNPYNSQNLHLGVHKSYIG